MDTPELDDAKQQAKTTKALEKLLADRIGWVDEVVSPFAARAAQKQQPAPEITKAA